MVGGIPDPDLNNVLLLLDEQASTIRWAKIARDFLAFNYPDNQVLTRERLIRDFDELVHSGQDLLGSSLEGLMYLPEHMRVAYSATMERHLNNGAWLYVERQLAQVPNTE